MLQAISWSILILVVARAVWLAVAPSRFLADRRRWQFEAVRQGSLAHARQLSRG
jgi:hypothetical protein